jgi:predicted dehydrogenase
VKPLRIAVIGAGHLGRIHTKLVKSIAGVELIGVVDPLAEARQRVEAEFGVAVFENYHALLDRIDAAIIATTTPQHHPVGREMLRRGIHVLVEKPVTSTVAEADELISLARAHDLVLQVGHVERFNPAWSAVSGFTRRPRHIAAVRSSAYTCRSTDVSVVLDLMIHDLDLAMSLVPSPVVEVDAVGFTVFGPHCDAAHAHLRFANDCIATLDASRTSFQPQRTMQVVSDRAHVAIDFTTSVAKVAQPSDEVRQGRLDVRQMSAAEQDHLRKNLFQNYLPLQEIQIEKRNAILDEQQEFVNCILTGTSPRVTGEQARDCLAVAERIQQSIAAKRSNIVRPATPDWTREKRRAG